MNEPPRSCVQREKGRQWLGPHHKPLMMHEFHNKFIWDSPCARGARRCASPALGQFTQSLLAVASGRRRLQRLPAETNFTEVNELTFLALTLGPHHKPVTMHVFHDHMIRDSCRVRARDAVVQLNSVPLPACSRMLSEVVTARVDRLIAEGGKGPYPDME